MSSSIEISKQYHKMKAKYGRQHFVSYYSFKKINDLSIFCSSNSSNSKPLVILTESNKLKTYYKAIKNIPMRNSLKKLTNKNLNHATTINTTSNIANKILLNHNSINLNKTKNKISPKNKNFSINIINNNIHQIQKIKKLKFETSKVLNNKKITLNNKIQKRNISSKKESKNDLSNKNNNICYPENLTISWNKKKSQSNAVKDKLKMASNTTEKNKTEKKKIKKKFINKTKLSKIKKLEISKEIKANSNLRKSKYLSIFNTINTTVNDIKKLINDVYDKKNGLLDYSLSISSIIEESMIFNGNVISLLNNNNDSSYVINLNSSNTINSTIYNDFSFDDEKQNINVSRIGNIFT